MQSKEHGWKPSTYRARASSRPYCQINGDSRQARPEDARPIPITEGCQATRDGFVEAFCIDPDAMLDTFDVPTAHFAGP